MKIYNGYKRLNDDYELLTDDYEYKMINGYLVSKKDKEEVVFDIFFRKVPTSGGYAIMAGLDKIIEFIKGLKYSERSIDYFERNNYPKELIEYLRNFKFTGDIYAVPDGTPVFPNEPLVTIKAPLAEAQAIETALLAIINGAMEHATAARRIVEAAPKGVGVMEFGARRADGLEAAIDSSLYAMMVGCVGTSNCKAADMVNKKAMGTMAHSWIESFDSELEAFKTFSEIYPDNCILLVDTYNTLKSGVPNAIKTFEYMREKGLPVDNIGVRIDSGDLAYLSKETRKMFKEAGFPQAKICLSNGLNADSIESLILQGAEFDILGVGDHISKPVGNMGNVYKEVELKQGEKRKPKIKLSDDTIKIVNPGYKKVYRAFSKETGYALADILVDYERKLPENNLEIVSPTDTLKRKVINNYELVELQQPIFINGELVYEDLDINDIKKYCDDQMDTLYPEIKRNKMPHEYPVSGTVEYVDFKYDLINKTKKLVK